MGKEENKDKNLDQDIGPLGLSEDEIVMLAYALEYDHSDEVTNSINAILEKIEQRLHVDTFVGNRLSEYGRIVGWSKE